MTKLRNGNGLLIFVFLFPIIDFLSFLSPVYYFLSLALKGVFVLYAILYLVKNTCHKRIFTFLGIYFFITICYWFSNNESPWLELMHILILYALPILILFFNYYENEKVSKKSITILFYFYSIFYLFFTLFKIDMSISLLPVFILLFSVLLCYGIESRCYLLKGSFLLLILLLILFIQDKMFFLSLFIIFVYFIILNRKKIFIFCKKNQFKALFTMMIFCLSLVIYMPEVNFKKEKISSIFSEIFTYSNINTSLNGRVDHLKRVQNVYKNSEALEKVFGLGIQKLETTGKLESDIFDIFYSIGILGLLFYFAFFVYVLGNSSIKKNYKFSFWLLFVLSFLGNVFLNPYVIPFLAMIFLISKNDQGVLKKDILFVSNMYPSKDYPHYGIFVKNTYDLLENRHSIDLVVMHKSIGKLKKFISYVKLFGLSFLKAVFNNYDFIYVHFVSHTTIGVFLPVLFSKNTKLILNVHGNDLVSDTNVDKKYLKLTRIFLKSADIVISPSKYFEKVLIKDYHIPKEKIMIYPSGGIDVNKFKKMNKKTALHNVGLESQYTYFGYIARIEKNKGYDTYVKAIHELVKIKKYKNTRFLLIGNGSEEDKLNNLIKKYKLENWIVRKDLVSQEELVSIYNALDVFIYPTRMKSESLGLTGLEAMACETLVIGSNKFGPNDYLMDNENSLTFNPSDYKELVEKMIEALEMNPKEKKKLTKNARKKSEEYSHESTEKILMNLFH